MRKLSPCVSTSWMATVTVHLAVLILGLLFSPIPFSTALKLNGTTTPSTRTVEVYTSTTSPQLEDELKTTITSFLQPDVPETTYIPQTHNQDELTTPSLLAKRHSSIRTSEGSSHENNAAQKFLKPFSSAQAPSQKPQKIGTGLATNATDEDNQSLSSSTENDMQSTTDHNASDGSGGTSGSNSVENKDSLSLDKDESDFSDNSEHVGGRSSGVAEGDVIYPPEGEVQSDELDGTTIESLVRPGPTTNPHESFATQLSIKLNKTSRLGTRGLSSKSELNAISESVNSTTPAAMLRNTTNNRMRFRKQNVTDNLESSDSSTDKVYVAAVPRLNLTSESDSNSTRFNLNGTAFSSRSNLHPSIHPQPQQFHRARPTTSVISYSTNQHNNNLHNRIIRKKKIPVRNNDTTGGSSLSSIYGNSILSSTASSNAGEEEEVGENMELPSAGATTATPTNTTADGEHLFGLRVSTVDSTTESNILNASQHGSSKGEQELQSSPPSTSGGDENNHNLTIPVEYEEYNNGSTLPSSSRAILGFGANGGSLGKVKRPKPIIIRDHEDALNINNISETGAAGNVFENTTSQVANTPASDETPASSIGEEDAKPVGNNALPTPPFKVRKVKLNSRRASTTKSVFDFEETTTPSPFPLSYTAGTISPISNHNRLVQAASGSGSNNHMQRPDTIRPSVSHEPPYFSTRRVVKEEFGIVRDSYNHHRDHEDDDEGLEATTEFYLDNSTPYPIPLGVRSVPGREESENNGERHGFNHEKSGGSGGSSNDNDDEEDKYRDYYSEIRSPDHGSGNSGNLHVKLDSHQQERNYEDVSPVTITVTHTVVKTTPRIIPTSVYGYGDNRNVNEHDVAKRGNYPNLHPTPALPNLDGSSKSTVAGGQGPAGGDAISKTSQNVQTSTSQYDDSVHNNDKVNHEMTPVPPQIESTPTVSSKDMKGVYFTSYEQPHYTSSSYEFTSSTMYSYSYPDDLHHEDEHHGNEGSSPEPEQEHNPEVTSSTIPDESPTTPPAFWDEVGNLTKSPSSKVGLTTMDQENGGVPTQTIDVDVYTPPSGVGHNSKVELTSPIPSSTRRVTTLSSTRATTYQVPGSVENNDEKHTTMKPPPSNSGTGKGQEDNGKVTEGGITKNHTSGSGKEPTNKEEINDEAKTPFGFGESFGIGSVHVPIMVEMVLDVTQTEFCSKLTSFKEMIVTVYETQKNIHVDPAQIVIYTKSSCDADANKADKSQDDSSRFPTTLKPEALTGKLITTKSPHLATLPSSSSDEKSKSQKDSAKNATSLSGHHQSVSNSSDLSQSHHNKSDTNSTHKVRSRRNAKMTGAGASIKNANFSDDIKGSNVTDGNSLSVYFYVNNKSGSYDQDLTSAFVRLWNNSTRLTNVSNENNSEQSGSHGSNNNSNDMFMKRVKKVGMITASHLISAQDSGDENSGIIIAITVASIVAVCLFVLGVGLLIMRHRQSQTKFAKRCTPVTLDDYSLDNISVYNSFRRKQRLRGSKRSYTNAAFDDPNAPSKPVNATQLAAALTDVPLLENEFRAIPNITATLDDIPHGAETKNRYANVIPMPDSRVLLTFQEDTPNSDYINANYVRGANGEPKKYIITQGPLEETIVDFWRMVWEQQIRVVFMLTDFAEQGIAKCSEYYPRSETIDCSQLHGDFQITLEKRDISDNCITSYLVIKDMERNLRRDVVHFWYHSWPDKGVPASPKMTIDFLNRTRKFTKEPIPVLIHCSPGTGRSGTIVACDIAMKEYDAQNKIDIPRIVMKLRQDRAGSVQTKEQYVHIYEVLHSYVSRLGSANLESI